MRQQKIIKTRKTVLTGCLGLFLIFGLFLGVDRADSQENSEPNPVTIDREGKTIDLLTKIDAFTESDERLRKDAAIAHYNMGNIYFHKGEYEIASREYYQAVTLMPDDPDCHFNLAFVSGEHLKDQRTALKHYNMYLYLNPNARDAHFVREKILFAQMKIHAEIDSPIQEKLNR